MREAKKKIRPFYHSPGPLRMKIKLCSDHHLGQTDMVPIAPSSQPIPMPSATLQTHHFFNLTHTHFIPITPMSSHPYCYTPIYHHHRLSSTITTFTESFSLYIRALSIAMEAPVVAAAPKAAASPAPPAPPPILVSTGLWHCSPPLYFRSTSSPSYPCFRLPAHAMTHKLLFSFHFSIPSLLSST